MRPALPSFVLSLRPLLLVGCCCCALVRPAVAKELAAEYAELAASYRDELLQLADSASAAGLDERARRARRWRPPQPSTGLLLFLVDNTYASDSAAAEVGGAASTEAWDEQFHDERRKYAERLFALAVRAADAGQVSAALQWATETVREHPDHHEARRVLGYEQHNDRWTTRYGRRMRDAGKVWHTDFGWVGADELPRYLRGERRNGRSWIDADEDARRHARIKQGWQVRTDHFLVVSNHSLKAAATIAARLERVHQVWRQLFAGFYLDKRAVRQLFAGERTVRRRSKPHRVVYHRDREQYQDQLVRHQPRIGQTLGIYFDKMGQSHFFAGPAESVGTQYHEVVHQLFQESRPAAQHVGALDNFWVVEGVACYFESLTEYQDADAGPFVTIGTSDAGRLPAARHRVLIDDSYVPLGELVSLGTSALQRREDIAKVYGESAALVTFLMHSSDGRRREALVEYLSEVYSGRADTTTLSELTGESYSQLDAEFRAFLERLL